MLTAALALAAVLLLLVLALARTAGRPAPPLPFGEHVATACALLQPDDPALPDDTQLADEVEAWLRTRTPTIRPAFPEES